jgi:hypothetical protein
MPSLFAYIVAVVVLLGGGYAGLRWLAEPEPVRVATHAGKDAAKEELSRGRKAVEQARPPADMRGWDSDIRGPVPGDAPSKPASEAAADPLATADPGKTTQPPTAPNPSTGAADVPQGGCMPFGITGKGELVFPMECQAILTQYGAGRKPAPPDPDASTPDSKPEQAGPAEHGEVAR